MDGRPDDVGVDQVSSGDAEQHSRRRWCELLGYQFNKRNDNSRDNTGVRVDYNLNERNTFSATYNWNRNFVDRPDIDTSFTTVPLINNDDHINFLSTAWRWNPKATVTNEVRFGFNFAPAYFLTAQKFAAPVR